MTSDYARGRRFEYSVRENLIRHGATNVMRSPMSRGPWDIRCDFTGPAGDVYPAYIQCKANKTGYVPPLEWNALYDTATARGGLALVAFKTPTHRITYRLIEGHKVTGKRKQPWTEWELT